MSSPAQRPATYADLLKVPDHLVAEIIDGELHTSPRPALRQAVSASVLGGDLNPPFQQGRGGPGGGGSIGGGQVLAARRGASIEGE